MEKGIILVVVFGLMFSLGMAGCEQLHKQKMELKTLELEYKCQKSSNREL